MNLYEEIYRKFLSRLSYSDDVGVEIELPVVNLDKPYTIDMNIIQELLKEFINNNFTILSKDNDGNLIAIKNKENNDTISLEYSCNTIELSLNKEDSIYKLENKFNKYYEFINSFLNKYNYKLCDSGINPNYKVINRECLNHDRYKMIEKLLVNKRNKLYSEFCSYCCSIQTHINVDIDDLVNVLNCFTSIEEIKEDMFGNSYMEETNRKNSRKFLWENSNFKPKNIGKNKIYKDIDDLINSYKKRNLFFIERNNKFILLKNKTSLENYFKNKTNIIIDDNIEYSVEPENYDFDNFRSYKSVELTKYGTLEIRTDCTQKIENIFRLVAFNVGIGLMSKEILEFINNGNIINKENLILFSIQGLQKRKKDEERYLEVL